MVADLDSAASSGDVDMLYRLLNDNPRILNSAADFILVDTPLHKVASSGDKAGSSSDDSSALQNKEWTIARALMRLDPELIRVKGRGGRTPLHVGAEVASPQLLAELLYVCPSSIEDVTNEWKSVVHVAVEAKRENLFAVLVGWLVRVKRENILHWKDMDGNTVLHAAVRTNQIEVVKRILRHMRDDVKNSKGETALAIHVRQENHDRIEEIGIAICSHELPPYHPKRLFMNTMAPTYRVRLGKFLSRDISVTELWWRRTIDFYGRIGFGSEQSKQAALVVAVLVATATYQGILSPPGGVWQDNSSYNANNITTTEDGSSAHLAGQMIMNGKNLSNYIQQNTLAFVVSVCLILACLPGDIVYGAYLVVSMIFLLFTYQEALDSIVPAEYATISSLMPPWIGLAFLLGCGTLILRWYWNFFSAVKFKVDSAGTGHHWELVGFDDEDSTDYTNCDALLMNLSLIINPNQ